MGRAREFDIDKALRIAADLFWRKGYDGASVSDMTDAMGIGAPSFYFAFGSKDGLFQRIVEDYQAQQAKLVAEALSRKSIKEAVAGLLYGFVDLFTERGRAPGCLIMNSSLPVIDGHPFRKRFAAERKALKATLQKRFKQIRQNRDEPSGSDPATLAQLVVTVVWGLAVEAQSGTSRASLRGTVAALCAGCCP
jgi:AcrR family transcriptional regulator